MQDHARTEEAYASEHALNHATHRVGPGSVSLLDRDHDNRRPDADQSERTEPGGLAMKLAIESDGRAASECREQTQHQLADSERVLYRDRIHAADSGRGGDATVD